MHEEKNDRFKVLIFAYIFVFFLIIAQLANLQIIQGEKYENLSQNRVFRERDVVALRGNILDTNNIPLATNRLSYDVQISRTGLDTKNLNKMILELANVFEKNNDFYDESFKSYLTINPYAYGRTIRNSEESIQKWKEEMILQDAHLDMLVTEEDVFNYFRDVKFSISSEYTDEEAYKITMIRYVMLIRGHSSINPLTIARGVSLETIGELEERYLEFPGIIIEPTSTRKYLNGEIQGHVVGYVGRISSQEYERLKESSYRMNDIIGKSGIESYAEKYLRGIHGQKRVEVDNRGRLVKESHSSPAIPGNDVILTLDSNLQRVAMESLKRNIDRINSLADNRTNFGDAYAGSVVAIDVNTGEVLVMANYPSYDPSVYVAASHDLEAQRKRTELLTDSKGTPMINRAIQGLYAPGSTYKPVTSITALEENFITPTQTINDRGTTVIGGWTFYCLDFRAGRRSHGHLDLKRAMATSCNIYFHEIGAQAGIDNIDKWSKALGLGERTGIDLFGELAGTRANRQTKTNDSWRPADTAQAAIGQFNNAFTPLQLANYTSIMANGGKNYTPHLIKKVISQDGQVVYKAEPQFEQIDFSPGTLEAIKESLVHSTTSPEGTATNAFRGFPYSVAGKTGTAERGDEFLRRSSNALFIAYAPAENPQIAIAVVIERGAWGSYSAPVARDVLEEYFGLNDEIIPEPTVTPDEVVLIR